MATPTAFYTREHKKQHKETHRRKPPNANGNVSGSAAVTCLWSRVEGGDAEGAEPLHSDTLRSIFLVCALHHTLAHEEGARACAREVVTRPATLTVTLRSVAAVPVPTGASRKKEGPAAASAQAAGRGQGPEKILSSAQHVRSGTGTTRTDFSTSVQPPVALYSLTATSPTAKALSQL